MTHETLEVRDLSATELDEVSGAIWHVVARIAKGAGMALLEGQQHNGTRTITMGELARQLGY